MRAERGQHVVVRLHARAEDELRSGLPVFAASTAAIATARKIAVFIYRALKYGRPLRDVGLAAYEQQFQDRQVRHLGKRAAALGYQIVPIPTQAAAGPN